MTDEGTKPRSCALPSNAGLCAHAEELQRLRAVYEASRRVLRFNGIDRERTIAAVDEMDDAIERVKSLYSGQEDDGA